MRCLYFKLKDKVFTDLGPIPQSDTEAMEEILKSTFGEHRKLGSKKYPRCVATVYITYGNISVQCIHTDVKLHSF